MTRQTSVPKHAADRLVYQATATLPLVDRAKNHDAHYPHHSRASPPANAHNLHSSVVAVATAMICPRVPTYRGCPTHPTATSATTGPRRCDELSAATRCGAGPR